MDNSTQSWYRQAIANNGRWALTGLREERQLFNTLGPNSEQVVTFCREIKNIDNYKRILRERPIDIVITDIRMPVMDGLELIRRIRAEAIKGMTSGAVKG